jgi:single-strand DNA-binding protein
MVNKVLLVGNVGKDPEVRHIESGVAVANFPIATNESYKNKSGERVTNTEWHNIVVWRGLAEVVEKYVKKGSLLYIEGKIRTRSYDDQNGNKRYITEIVADNLKMLDRSSGGDSSQSQESQPQAPEGNFKSDETDDLPF